MRTDLDTYIRQMNSNVDKNRILEYVKPGDILEVGSGGGIILDIIRQEYPTSNIIGVDLNENMIEICRNKGHNVYNKNICRDKFNGKYDTIIFSSVLHEIYSFDDNYNIKSVETALLNAKNMLKPDGVIIIRDMLRVENSLKILKIKTLEARLALCKFLVQSPIKISYVRLSRDYYLMNLDDIREFMYTYSWGMQSFDYEIKERYGYMTEDDIHYMVSNILEMKEVYYDSELQDGYLQKLKDEVTILDKCGINKVEFPDSTYFLVIKN